MHVMVLFYIFRQHNVMVTMYLVLVVLCHLVSHGHSYDWVDGPTDTPDPCPGLYCGRTDRGEDYNATEVTMCLNIYI